MEMEQNDNSCEINIREEYFILISGTYCGVLRSYSGRPKNSSEADETSWTKKKEICVFVLLLIRIIRFLQL